jgi:Plasmid encoded RepA protein.
MSGTELEEKLDQVIAILMGARVPRDRILLQLKSSGTFPIELLRSRFTDLPDTAFEPIPTTAPSASSGPLRPLGEIEPSPDESPERKQQRMRGKGAGQSRKEPPPRSPAVSQTKTSGSVVPLTKLISDVPIAKTLDEQKVSFQFVPLIQCSFPHADPGELTTYKRRNGWLEVCLATNRPAVGLPYGVPARILTIYCTSEVVRTRSPEIFLGNTINDFLRKLEIPITRGERGSVRTYANQLMRLIHCVVSIDENLVGVDGRTGLHIRQALFVEEACLWWDEAAGLGQGSSIVLSRPLFESMLERAAPLSTDAIKALRRSPMDLDIYSWLCHRLYHLKTPSQIRWDQLSEQFGHGYSELRFFRRYFLDSLKRVLRVYSDANVSLNDHGVLLRPSRPHVAPTKLRTPV